MAGRTIDGTPEDVYLRAATVRTIRQCISMQTGGVLARRRDGRQSLTRVPAGLCSGNYEMTLAANQTSFSATGYLYDSDFQRRRFQAMN